MKRGHCAAFFVLCDWMGLRPSLGGAHAVLPEANLWFDGRVGRCPAYRPGRRLLLIRRVVNPVVPGDLAIGFRVRPRIGAFDTAEIDAAFLGV